MKAPQNINEDLIFTTTVSTAKEKEGEFLIELFPYTSDVKCEGTPVKTIRNFDELIDFFESEDLDKDKNKKESE